MNIPFTGRVLVLGCGSVARCLLPLLRQHLQIDLTHLTVIDFEDLRSRIPDTLAAGAHYVQHRITPDNMDKTLAGLLGPGDLLIDLAWNIETGDIVQWCHDHGVLYINTSVEVWDPYANLEDSLPTERTLYVRHLALRKMAASWSEPGPTAVLEHGANPGLVSHWARAGLEDLSAALLLRPDIEPVRRTALEAARAAGDYARLAMHSGVKVIHISERDTQIATMPKRVDEFVNTWSVEGFYEEGIAPAEMGWGTHERTFPPGTHVHRHGPGNAICLSRMGMNTFVRSWTPGGPIIGMVVRHGEAFTLSDYLTVWEEDRPLYRPTVHYAYLPSDAALASLHELRMTGYDLQSQVRIMSDEISDGRDELGVLLLGHDLNGWWTGSQLDIHEARRLAPGQNATTLQVAASVLAAVGWMIAHPAQGLCLPEDLPHHTILDSAAPYLGPVPSVQTNWTPLQHHWEAFARFGHALPGEDELWQFGSFIVR